MRSTALHGRRPGDKVVLETCGENRDEHRDALDKALDVPPVFPVNDEMG